MQEFREFANANNIRPVYLLIFARFKIIVVLISRHSSRCLET